MHIANQDEQKLDYRRNIIGSYTRHSNFVVQTSYYATLSLF